MPDVEPTTRPPRSTLVTQFLSHVDAPCPRCGFNLRGVPEARCPECGSVLQLTLEGAHRRQRAFIVGLVALAMGFGACAVVLGAALVQSVPDLLRGRPRFSVDFDPAHALTVLVLTPIFWVALWAWLRWEQALARSGRGPRIGAAAICVAAVLALAVLLGFIG